MFNNNGVLAGVLQCACPHSSCMAGLVDAEPVVCAMRHLVEMASLQLTLQLAEHLMAHYHHRVSVPKARSATTAR
jgi:hypothetical protein